MKRRGRIWIELIFASLTGAGLLLLIPVYFHDRNWDRCTDPNVDIRIAGCTAVIDAFYEIPYTISGALNNRGTAFRRKGEPERAIADYTEAIRLNPKYAQPYHNRAVIHGEAGRYDQAIADLDQAIRLEPKYANAWNGRCWTRALMGQLQEALADCDESLKLGPDNPVTLASRALAYLKMNRPEPAIQDYTAALKRAPKAAGSLYGRGLARRIQGDETGAAADMDLARTIDPHIAQVFAGYGVPDTH